MGWGSSVRVALSVAGFWVAAISATAAADDAAFEPCTLEPGPMHTVARVLDAETLVLDDGSAVRLIGALAPRARDAGAQGGSWPPEIKATKFLSDLVLGKTVKLAFGGRKRDRYGRLLAQVFVADGGKDEWVEGALLAEGHARMYGLQDSFACARELLAHEAEARRKHLGLWSNDVYRPLPANRPDALMRQRGKYVRVIGSVVTIGRTKSTTYLNFGAEWHSDFTVRISKRVLSVNSDFARVVDGLAAKTIIVRGWIERRGGPLIDLVDASQIEVISNEPSPNVSAVGGSSHAQPARAPANSAIESDSPKQLRPAPTKGTEPGAVNL
jgi:endonuclease YncB( thermonuclease family)